jgi:hypothetical protein
VVLVIPALLALGWWLWRSLRATSNHRGLRSRARFIDGPNHIPVSIALERSRIAFFNSEFADSLSLDAVETIEYVSDLVTGDIADGAVMRLTSRGHEFDFAMDAAAATEWSRALPPR